MSGMRIAMFFALVVSGAVVSNAIGQIAFPLNESLCVAWSGDAGACVVSNGVETVLSSHAHVVPVIISGFVFFVLACRICRARGASIPAFGVVLYSAISWALAQYFDFSGVTPEDALAVVFSGACGLFYFHLRSVPVSPNKTMEPTR